MNEPCFDNSMIEQLKIILEGIGTFVHRKNVGDDYLRPTPVMITSNTLIWNICPQSKDAIMARLVRFYNNLQESPFLEPISKDLHPNWLNQFAIRFNLIDLIDLQLQK